MITPAYPLTATERVLPRMALDFTTGVLDSRVTIARDLNTATRTNSSGVIEIVNANLPRFDYNPVTLAARGLLIEETRTNLFLNSLINGTSLSTQSVTVTAVAHTISFYGTGTITLSGAATATVVGTGAYPNRQTLTFTPIVGVLVCTVTGSVQYAQIEIGSFATSFIPTAATSVARNADAVTMTGTNFSTWYNASEGTFVVRFLSYTGAAVNSPRIFAASNSSSTNRIRALLGATDVTSQVTSGGVVQATLTNTPSTLYNNFNKLAFGYKANNFVASTNAGVVASDLSGSVPATAANILNIGSDAVTVATTYINGYISSLFYYPQCLTTNETQAFSKG